MVLMVAVGAMAITLLFRRPCSATRARTPDQSSELLRSTSTGSPRSSSSSASESSGSRPRSHLLPSYEE